MLRPQDGVTEHPLFTQLPTPAPSCVSWEPPPGTNLCLANRCEQTCSHDLSVCSFSSGLVTMEKDTDDASGRGPGPRIDGGRGSIRPARASRAVFALTPHPSAAP